MSSKIKEIISKMTLDEKVAMCSGKDFWHLEGIDRLGVPSTMVTDGPHGLRKQSDSPDHLGINDSIEAVCFPTAVGAATSFDRDMMTKLGEILGEECQAENVSVLLGPAVNIKRSPLCGRNFEYLSEDPYLTGELAAAYINGVQSKNVGTSIKHFAANNQETRRMTSSSNLDERTLREIYLPAFETAVKKAKPWSVMSSYNRINGEYVSESKKFLTDILRGEWGFDGYVVSDWSGTNDRVKGVEAGEDLEMPGNGGINDAKIIEAVKNGILDEKYLDAAVENILNIVFKYEDNRDSSAIFDRSNHHKLARAIAGDSMVLLKNIKNILPLNPKGNIAFIGEFAEKPRIQGSGSSHVNSHRVVGALEAVQNIASVSYAQGYRTDQESVDSTLQSQAVEVAKNADVAVIFAGLPGNFESEGFDRTHMSMPECQNSLIDEILKVQKNVVVVLHNGSPITMPWIDHVDGVLESYLGGEAMGEAEVDILFGAVNPSGKLAETFPLKLEHNPSFPNFPGEVDEVNYSEGIFVGYRYYDKKKIDVLFPFGHGLSYTEFEYSNLKISNENPSNKDDVITVTVDVKNVGNIMGKEIVQLYIAQNNSPIIRPEKELKNFGKIELMPGETKSVTMVLDYRSFAFFDIHLNDWSVLSGDYAVLIGKSSQNIVVTASISWVLPPVKGFRVHDNTTLGDVLSHPVSKPIMEQIMAQAMQTYGINSAVEDSSLLGDSGPEMMIAMMKDVPLRSIRNFGGEPVAAVYDDLMAGINAALENAEKEY